ncbi:MAG: Trm112 family protein [Gemmatimonadota bacterium]|nr:MAG: Trm112 family protein [Gemmatimonadota bacterium]
MKVMVEPELLEILVCPETRQPVRLADADTLARLNSAIEAGNVVNQGGQEVREAIAEGLIRQDGKVLYPVREDIPIMLIDEAIVLDADD